jgi:hypothetical protein
MPTVRPMSAQDAPAVLSRRCPVWLYSRAAAFTPATASIGARWAFHSSWMASSTLVEVCANSSGERYSRRRLKSASVGDDTCSHNSPRQSQCTGSAPVDDLSVRDYFVIRQHVVRLVAAGDSPVMTKPQLSLRVLRSSRSRK